MTTRTTAPRACRARKGPRALAVLGAAATLALLGTIISAWPIETQAAGTSGFPGLAWAWGGNSNGQLGNGTTTNSLTPVPVSGLSGAIAISGGAQHSLAVKSDGTAWAWGYNFNGELGNGTTTNSLTPVQVSGLSGMTAIAGGDDHSLALKSDGTIWAWGSNVDGQLGNGTTTNSLTPVQVSGLSGATAIASGRLHSLAVKSDGTVWAWGNNSAGQLGNGTTTNSPRPVQVSGLSGMTAIAGGEGHSLALKSDGTVWAWGSNVVGQIGQGYTSPSVTPVQVCATTCPGPLSGVTAIAGGYWHSLALKSDGTVWAWGFNSDGMLGDGTFVQRDRPVLSGLSGATAIAGGGFHSLALKSDGTVWAWGHNVDGELGDGTTIARPTPVQVSGPSGATAIAGGGLHSLALKLPTAAVFPAVSNGAYGGYVTADTIQNTGSAPAIVRIAYFNQNGAPVGTGDSISSLPVNASWTVRQDNGNSFPSSGGNAAQAGSAVVYSSQPIASFVNEFAPGNVGDATSYSGVQVPSGVGAILYAPAIVNNAYGGYITGIGLLNQGNSPTDVTITYRDGSGTAIKTQTVSGLAAHAYQALYSGDAGLALPSGFAGTATITSSAGQPMGAIVNETGPGGQFSSYDAVPSGRALLNVPVALNNAYGGYYTGMGIQNTSASPGTVSVTYYDALGTATPRRFSISPFGSLGVYQGSSTDGPAPGAAYTARITSTVPVAAIVNEVAPAGAGAARQSTAYNTFPAGASALNLPLVESAGSDGWSTGEGIMNTGAATTVTVNYFDTATGAPVGTPQNQVLQPNAFWGLYQPVGGLPNGTRASAQVTTGPGGQVAVICNESNPTTFMSYNGQ